MYMIRGRMVLRENEPTFSGRAGTGHMRRHRTDRLSLYQNTRRRAGLLQRLVLRRPVRRLLHPSEQFPVVDELALPITIAPGQAARGTTATEVQPANVIAAVVQRKAHGDLELVPATHASVILQLRP